MNRRQFIEGSIVTFALGVNMAPEIAKSTFQIKVLKPAELFLPTQMAPSESQILQTPLVYKPGEKAITLLCFGDSNMRGGAEPDAISPADFAAKLAKSQGIGEWTVRNYSRVGDTTEKVKEQLKASLRRQDLQGAFDIWLNVGGNDLKKITDDPQKAKEMQDLAGNPLRNSLKLWPVGRQIIEVIDDYGQSLSEILDLIADYYRGRIRHMVLITPPNFSKASYINTGNIEGVNYKLPLNDPVIKGFAHNISVQLNRQMVRMADQFSLLNPDIPIIGIDTSDFQEDSFGDGEHFNDKGKQLIAERVIERIKPPSS